MTRTAITLTAIGIICLFAGSITAGVLVAQNEKAKQSVTTAPQVPAPEKVADKQQVVGVPEALTHEATENPVFIADEGIRMENASNPGAKMSNDTLLLLYENQREKRAGIASAEATSDWLDFTAMDSNVSADNFRAHKLPDGTWRAYGINTTLGIEGTCLKSKSSNDGITFTDDEGCRYELHEDDNGRMGVYDFFNAANGDVHMLYIGDMMGLNNVRRAVSEDNGWTFTFVEGNVLDDEADGGGNKSYVDEKTIKIDDTSIYLVAMKQGVIYGFLSTDDGETFVAQGQILSPTDFGNATGSLHDPQIVQLPDGRYRIFVALMDRETGTTSIVSATAEDLP